MAFTVSDFHDLLRLLAEHPEWRDDLRRHVLGDAFVDVPVQMRELQGSHRETMAELHELQRVARETLRSHEAALARLDRIEPRLDSLDQHAAETVQHLSRIDQHAIESGKRIDSLDEHAARSDQRLDRLERRMDRLSNDVGDLKGTSLEERYRHRPFHFQQVIEAPEVLDAVALDTWLRECVALAYITPAEAGRLALVDLVIRSGVDRTMFAIAEISWSIDIRDVERALDRAALMRKTTTYVLPVVAGRVIADDAQALAERSGVAIVIEQEN